eukprot:Gb_24332 [translate_table: standard]
METALIPREIHPNGFKHINARRSLLHRQMPSSFLRRIDQIALRSENTKRRLFRTALHPRQTSSSITCQISWDRVRNAEAQDSDIHDTFQGLGELQNPLKICQTHTLPPALTLADALQTLKSELRELNSDPPLCDSGILRFQVPVGGDIKALQWLRSQPQLPCCYFSPRSDGSSIGEPISVDALNGHLGQPNKSIVKGVAGIGSAVLFKSSHPFSSKDWRSIKRFLSEDSPLIRAYGAIRFNSEEVPSSEWSGFGSFYFVVPQIEFDEFEIGSLLAVTIAWDHFLLWTFRKAIDALERTLHQISVETIQTENKFHSIVTKRDHVPDEHSWNAAVQKVLKMASSSSGKNSNGSLHSSSFPGMTGLSKVVLARRTKLETNEEICPLALLACLQEKDKTAYQFCIRLPDCSAFIGNTPEQLFYRNGLLVSSEAVAGTRARGHTTIEDLQIGIDLLLSPKEHNEFAIVRESIKCHLENICKHVGMETEKTIIKQARVQHLYARMIGELKSEAGEFDLLSSLHPTPAVCGYPQEVARVFINQTEMFDRGMYAGPVGWFGGKEAEFSVGIRSALVQKGKHVNLYAGAGIVKGANSASEWQELELKASQFENLLQPVPPVHISQYQNLEASAKAMNTAESV